jgi:hypothetical protein
MAAPDLNPSSPESRLTGAERRAHPRFARDLEARCRVASAEAEPLWVARVRDISAGGIGLLLSRELDVGELLTVEVRLADGTHAAPQTARVTNTRAHLQGGWVVGCQLLTPLGEDQLRAFLGPTAEGGSS